MITERPLYGHVEIQRIEPTWRELRRNLVPNPSFENGLAGWTASGLNAAPSTTDEWAAAGSRAAAVALSNSQQAGDLRMGSTSAPVPFMLPGRTYHVAAVVQLPEHAQLLTNDSSRQRRLLLWAIDQNNNPVARFGPQVPNTAGVHELRATIEIPATWKGAIVGVGLAGGAADAGKLARFDAVYVSETPGDYFDGDTAPTGTILRTRWLGQRHQSASVLETRSTEFLAAATSVTIRRGGARTALGVRTDVGLMTFDLLDAEDPMRGGTFQPGQEVRAVSRDRAGGMSELFTGRVVDVTAAYPMNKGTGRLRSVTRVTVADAVKVHGETPRYGVTIPAGFETFEARIQRLSSSALAPIEPPVEGAPREVYAL